MTTIHTQPLSTHAAETPHQPCLPGLSPVWLELPELIVGHFNRLIGTGFVDGLLESALLAIWEVLYGDENDIIVVPNPHDATQPFEQPAHNVVSVFQLEEFVELLHAEEVGAITEAPKVDWTSVKVSRDTRAEVRLHLEEILGGEREASFLANTAIEAIQRTFTGDIYVDITLPDGVTHEGRPALPAWFIFENLELGHVWRQVLVDNGVVQ
jgi:hypothetical protein